MKPAVYPFSEVLRGLRNQADLSVEKAGFATGYDNYERWESGQTRVGADHLQNIAAAFGVERELWLLVYGWLVDRFTPQRGCEPVELSGAVLGPVLEALPNVPLDLGDCRQLALRDGTHTQLAVFGLIARYGGGYAGADAHLVLAPRERATVPSSIPAGSSVLRCLYGDVERDLLRFLGRTLIASGLGGLRGQVQRDVQRQALLLATEPDCVGELLSAGAPPTTVRPRGFNRLAALAARVAPRFQRMSNRQLEDLGRLEEAVAGAPPTVDDVKSSLREVIRDDAVWESSAALPTDEAEVGALPEPDPAVTRQMRALHDQADRTARRALDEQLDDARAVADPSAAFDALYVLEAGPSAD